MAPMRAGPNSSGTPRRLNRAINIRWDGGYWDTHPSSTIKVFGINHPSGSGGTGPARRPRAMYLAWMTDAISSTVVKRPR